ncbi:MAG: ABC transporter substrate-binding protein [Proteobacteria bacterium]|nr:ABC transporter substrate-binding protein [Pseudomonadota bacterium]
MKKMILNFTKVASLLFLLLNVVVAQASDSPAADIKGVIEQVRKEIEASKANPDAVAVDDKLKRIIIPMFDFAEMSKRSLGSNWPKISETEQKEFVVLFSDLLSSTYLKRIKSGVQASNIKSMTDSIEGEKALVKSIVALDGDDFSMDYRLINQSGAWKIYDVVIENVGLVGNYRSEFSDIIKKDGFPGLMQKLKNKQIAGIKK